MQRSASIRPPHLPDADPRQNSLLGDFDLATFLDTCPNMSRPSTKRPYILAIASILASASFATAQLPRVRLDAITPAGGQIGTLVPVTVRGELSDGATDLVFSHPDIEAIQQQEPASDFRVPHRKPNQFEVRIGDHVPPGRYEVRALGPAGLSAPRSFIVDHLSHHRFEPNQNSKTTPFSMEVGQFVHAQTRSEQRDYYTFTAEQHRPLLIQVLADRIDSTMDAVLSVYGPDGRRLHKARQSLTQDPALSFDPPKNGDYLVEVHDATFQGNQPYALEVSERPWIEAIFPPIAQPGVETEFTVFGYNLPNGQPISGFETRGHLQQSTIRFTPTEDLASTSGNWVTRMHPAAARLDGSYYRLAERFSAAPPVFLAASPEPVTRETDSSSETPQPLVVPAEVTGQFFPKHDRDWFEFEAKKNQSLWIELTTSQFGLPTDAAIRIHRKRMKDGKVTLQSLSHSDDIEGPPNNRSRRRFDTGTRDVSLAFRPPEDGTYVLSVSDQFNTVADDPRLTYRLTVTVDRPDYQLVAFADPERFPDEKIARPNGLGILPGGSSAIRVRLLPQHQFREAVTVQVENLPTGVTANPLTLSPETPEGLLVVEAARDAGPAHAAIQIVGHARRADETLVRVAKTAAIAWGANNTDAQATRVRMADDLQLAVLAVKPSPIRIELPQQELVSCRGAKLPLTVQIDRRDDFADVEVTLSGTQLPGGLKLDAKKSKTGTLELQVDASDAKLKPGRYSVALAAKVKDKRPKNPTKIQESQADVAKVNEAITKLSAQQSELKEWLEQAQTVAAATKSRLTAAQSRAAEPRNQLTSKLQQQQKLATSFLSLVEQAAQDPTNQELQAKLSDLEKQIAAMGAARTDLQEKFGGILGELSEIGSQLSVEETVAKEAADALAENKQKEEAAQKELDAAKKRLQDAEKNQQVDVDFWVYSKNLTIDVQALPVIVHTNTVTAQRGTQVEIPFLVERKFGFAGQVTLEANPPGSSHLTASPLALGPGSVRGKLPLSISDNAPLTTHRVPVRVKLNFNGVAIDERVTTVEVHVQEAREAER